MPEIQIVSPGCDDDDDDCEDGERGKRGKRGKRGPRGHDGSSGDPGATGPTGPTGTGSGAPTTEDVSGIALDSVPIPLPSNDVIAWITVNPDGTNTFSLPDGTTDGQEARLVFINRDGTNPTSFVVTGSFFFGQTLLPLADADEPNTGQCAADLVWRVASSQWFLTGTPLNIALG